jgi:hypothetical protein
MRHLTASTVPVGSVDASTRDALFALYEAYYEAVDRVRFLADFEAKDDVILLRDRDTREPRGFSTLKRMTVRHGGRVHHGVYSGDTVVDHAYWGQTALGHAFLRYLLVERARRPFSPLWWFLISKGYKTYLMMANNFAEHWPRHEEPTPPEAKAVMDGFATQAFGDRYAPSQGLVRFDVSQGHLRAGVAAIDEDLLRRNPRVRFFQERNPGWTGGDELVCVARMRWTMPLTYAWKKRREAITAREGR